MTDAKKRREALIIARHAIDKRSNKKAVYINGFDGTCLTQAEVINTLFEMAKEYDKEVHDENSD